MDSNPPTDINSAEQIPSMRLKEYEHSLEIHLRKILTEMEDQQTNMVSGKCIRFLANNSS